MDVNEVEGGSELAEVMSQAAALADAGDEERALEILLEAERSDPDDPTLLCMLGTLFLNRNADGMAIDFFQRCLAQSPVDATILVTAGSALAAAGDPAAEPALRFAALTAPDSAPARMHFGLLLVRTGLLEQGVEELQEARRLGHDDPLIQREVGVGFLSCGREPEALEAFEAAVLLDPDDPDARLLFGLTLLQTGDADRAAEELHPASTALPEDSEVQLLLALVFANAGWEEEAWLALSRAEAAPDPADPAYLSEVEEALEAGDDVVGPLLLSEFVPSFLRDRIYRG